ncbi:uncharacterized protein LOC122018835 isoform X1 [Zingiber officinale]|uniref:uncharacterized protein LOC122018835 isoform X1 n=1 Tax=Zingiber officinale TaxID=94328 RepID=UPI001C4AE6F9|nr:uncharacterized protein LOC122018835 isoform X1 [Zingiber officinale]
MNFLIRTTLPVVPEVSRVAESDNDNSLPLVQQLTSTSEGLISKDQVPNGSTGNDAATGSDKVGDAGSVAPDATHRNQGYHTDVSKNDGWITIPNKELPDNWAYANDISQLRSWDRSFIFPGEQICILVCLSASNSTEESKITTPPTVVAPLLSNAKSNPNKSHPIENVNEGANSITGEALCQLVESDRQTNSDASILSPEIDISLTEFPVRFGCHTHQTERLLESFRNSNFFVRITEADEELWSKKNAPSQRKPEVVVGRSQSDGQSKKIPKKNAIAEVVDMGGFDGNTSGGVARDTVRCCSLSNGDVAVLLEVNVGVSNLKDPVLEVIQFEKYQKSNNDTGNFIDLPVENKDDPYHELLHWLLPLDRIMPPPRPLSSPFTSSISQKITSTSGSQIFSFALRSYSMPSLPQGSGPASVTSFSNTKPASEPEDYNQFSLENFQKSKDIVNEGLLSFRGVSLEPQRFSAHCGLEGMYLPGRRWRRKLEIINPVEIHSFTTECNTEDLLCVKLKNVSPVHTPDIVIFVDAMTIVSEDEAPIGGSPLSIPIASIETGNGHSLPDLALRRGEEHSFILKLAARANKNQGNSEMARFLRISAAAPGTHVSSSTTEGMSASSTVNQFAILVSCRCNYTESKLFFKHLIDWRPRIARDLMVSIVSDKKIDTPIPRAPQLPIMVLTLEATNLTNEDLTFTVLSSEPSVSPSVLSLNSTPKSPMNIYPAFHDYAGKTRDRCKKIVQVLSPLPVTTTFENESSNDSNTLGSEGQETSTLPDHVSSNCSGLTHLWMQSAVPLGCIPAHSSATVKLELLPLTDGIIPLDTLRIAVKEKGMSMYIFLHFCNNDICSFSNGSNYLHYKK